MKPKIIHPVIQPSKNPELRHLAKLVGTFIEYWGFKSVQGRMWCYLYLLREPLSSLQLSQLLKVSPALVTQSVQILLQYGVIAEQEKGPNGVLRFGANANVADAIAGVLSKRESLLLAKIEAAHLELNQSDGSERKIQGFEVDIDRLQQVGQWINLASLFLQMGIGSLKVSENPFKSPERFKKGMPQLDF